MNYYRHKTSIQATMILQAKQSLIMFAATVLFLNRPTQCSSVASTTTPSTGAIEALLSNDKSSERKCGVPAIKPNTNSRIVGGSEAIPNSWPWQASLRYRQCGWCHECGAALIYAKWVITAAHCAHKLKPSEVRVVLGEHNLRTKEETERTVQIRQIILHEGYDHGSSDNDIALLRLNVSVKYNRFIQPICLPSSDVTVETQCIVTGWGETRLSGTSPFLNQVTVPILNHSLCNRATWYNRAVSDNMICAGYAEGRKDACTGDSGGPLVCPAGGGKWTLDGLTSWGVGCARPETPGVYTRVANYLGWIKAKTGK